MTRTIIPRPARRAVVVHALSTALVTATVAVLAVGISTAAAIEATHANAASIADTVAHTVAAPLARTDITSGGRETRAAFLAEMQPFIDAGVIDRAKVWHVEGEDVVVLFSDEPRNEGTRRPFDPDLAARLDDGEVVVFDVPDDAEHQHEFGQPGALEAFIGFEDAQGEPIRLELYLPASGPSTLTSMLAAMLPVAVLGPLILGAATLPLSVRLARRVHRAENERQKLLRTALAASDRERQRLAARLHDGIIQDLASIGLTLENLGVHQVSFNAEHAAILSRLGGVVDADISELRAILTGLTPAPFNDSLERSLHNLVAELTASTTRITLRIDEPIAASPEVAALVYQVAQEVIRNALDHAAPTLVAVHLRDKNGRTELDVTDNGRGFSPNSPADEGHVGLRLIRQAIALSNGTFVVESSPAGTHVHASVPSRITSPTS
ncbi:sensor histidine kinase [Microbacterium sp.]|uniref:sensor histidine kinase n=1 Tax=Microbacterium sp. TaxID=51671 RepID=UPI003C738C64